MSLPDGAEFWWDAKGYGSCYKPSKSRKKTPEQKTAHEARLLARQ